MHSEVAAVYERGTDRLVQDHLQNNPPPLALYPGRDSLRVSYPAGDDEEHGSGSRRGRISLERRRSGMGWSSERPPGRGSLTRVHTCVKTYG